MFSKNNYDLIHKMMKLLDSFMKHKKYLEIGTDQLYKIIYRDVILGYLKDHNLSRLKKKSPLSVFTLNETFKECKPDASTFRSWDSTHMR